MSKIQLTKKDELLLEHFKGELLSVQPKSLTWDAIIARTMSIIGLPALGLGGALALSWIDGRLQPIITLTTKVEKLENAREANEKVDIEQSIFIKSNQLAVQQVDVKIDKIVTSVEQLSRRMSRRLQDPTVDPDSDPR